ncbi:MAG: ArdC family protein [Hyphomonadaceae bacterium JAD_PAG50586_4]|nr:MAG: ArdC family protein [Hyphomonadaceae bacterium JAD_PAG50586_4]
MRHASASSSGSPAQSASIAARVTAQIRDALNHGVRPWGQPWDNATALALPLRHNGVPYRGYNIIALWAAAAERQFTHRHWFSFKQAQALGGAVGRGERATHITFYTTRPTEAEDAPADRTLPAAPQRAILRIYAVFNAAQIDNLPAHFYATPLPITDCDDTAFTTRFANVPAVIQHGGARAC